LNQITVDSYTAGATVLLLATTGTIANGDTIKIAMDDGSTFSTTVSGSPTGTPGSIQVTLASALPSALSVGAVCKVPTLVLGQITAPAFMAAATVSYFDGYFVFEANGTNQFFISANADGTQYDGNDFASAQANPDRLLAVINYHEQLLLAGTKTIEVWYDAGAANFPFQRFDGAFIQRGLAAPLAWVKEDNSVFWLGEDGIFYRLFEGYQPRRVSTFGTETAWGQYPSWADASAYVVTMEGHKWIFLSFPQGPATWCYDISSGLEQPLWHERISQGDKWI
jgi:hypothetical protein